MATIPSGGGFAFRRTDYGRANEAIDSVLARASHEQRAQSLKEDYRERKVELNSYKARVEARVDRAKRLGRSIERYNKSLQAESDRLESFVRSYEAKKAAFDMLTNKYTVKKGGKTRLQFDDKMQHLRYMDEKKYLEMMFRQYQQQRSSLQAQSNRAQSMGSQYKSLTKSAKKMNQRYKKMYSGYERAVQKYNDFANFIPYQPA